MIEEFHPLVRFTLVHFRIDFVEGLRWSEYLKSRGVDIQVYMFPEVGHALDTLAAELYGYEQIFSFFEKQFK